MTKKTLEKLPENIRFHIEALKKHYNNDDDKRICRIASYNYTLGLRDAGLITERERQVLFVYTTV